MSIKLNKENKRSFDIKPNSINESERTAEVIFATEKPVLRTYIGGSYWEKMLVSPETMDLTRFKSGNAPILNNHKSNSLEDQIGVIVDTKIENKQAIATLKFSNRESVNEIWEDVKNGILKGISVGYSIDEYTEEEGDEYPILIGKKWTPHEVSLVCVPADENCYVRKKNIEIEEKMDSKNTPKTEETKTSNTLGIKKEKAQEIDVSPPGSALSERARILDISRLCKVHNINQKLKNEFINKGTNMSDVKDIILEKQLKTEDKNLITQVKNKNENVREKLTDAISYRIGGKLTESAKQYKDYSLIQIARTLTGDNTSSDNQVVTQSMMTSDLPKLLENALNKTLLSSYESMQQKQNFWSMCSVSETKDFKEFSKYRLSEMPGLELQAEGENITFGSLSESKISGSIATFAKGISFSRKMMINDDLGALQNITQAWAQSVIRLENKLFWDHFNNNTTLSTGHKLFSSGNNNVSTTSEALSVEAISKARVQMMRQKSIAGSFELNIVPDLLIVSPELELEALKLVSRDMLANETGEINPYKGSFQVIVSPYLKDKNTWYLACSKENFGPAFEAVYLSGQRIFVDHQVDFNNDSLQYKVRCDMGVVAVEPKALLKNKGK